MKKFHNIRKKLLRQMAFSVFVMTILPFSTRTAPSGTNSLVLNDTTGGAGLPDVQPEPGRCADYQPNTAHPIAIGSHQN
jgi:hypothetical protein